MVLFTAPGRCFACLEDVEEEVVGQRMWCNLFFGVKDNRDKYKLVHTTGDMVKRRDKSRSRLFLATETYEVWKDPLSLLGV